MAKCKNCGCEVGECLINGLCMICYNHFKDLIKDGTEVKND